MHTQTAMTKTISLADDAYEALAACKRPGESFSDVARRLVQGQQKRSLLDLAGAWGSRKADADRIKATVYRARDESMRPRVKGR